MNDSSSASLQLLFDAALQSYEKQTGQKLVDHPLSKQLENCHSLDSVMDILQQQARNLTKFRGDEGKVTRSLWRVVHVLHSLSTSTLGEGIGLPFPPAKPIFAAIGILLAAAKDVRSSYDALIDLLETIEHFLGRLEVYVGLPLTAAMGQIIVKIMVELLSTIALATKQIKQSRPMKLVKKILGENEVESVLQRLDRLTLDEARATATQTFNVVHGLVQNVRVVMDDGRASGDAISDALKMMQEILDNINESQRKDLQRETRKWLSPPDPWRNHNMALESRYTGTSTWFVEGDSFSKWKSSGPDSLLWIYGKSGAGKSVICSTIVEDVNDMRKQGLASLVFFYCDSEDDDKKNLRGLVSSLLVQLCDHSPPYSTILSDFYSVNGDGSRQPSDGELIRCLSDMLKQPGQATVYIIIDGLDAFPDTFGIPSPREKVLKFLEGLVDLHLRNIRICVTSRPEADIRTALNPLPFRTVSLQEESGQRQDIVNYVKSVVNTDAKMRKWKAEDKELVINVLTRNVDRMFGWASCQLEFLRHCLPARIWQALEELSDSIDGT